jgi:hypothetical protein
MGDLLGSLVQGSQKRTILCVIWGGMLHIRDYKSNSGIPFLKKKKTTLIEHIRADNKTCISNRFFHCTLQQNSLVKSATCGT